MATGAVGSCKQDAKLILAPSASTGARPKETERQKSKQIMALIGLGNAFRALAEASFPQMRGAV